MRITRPAAAGCRLPTEISKPTMANRWSVLGCQLSVLHLSNSSRFLVVGFPQEPCFVQSEANFKPTTDNGKSLVGSRLSVVGFTLS